MLLTEPFALFEKDDDDAPGPRPFLTRMRHLRYPKGTPLANLGLTLLDKLGVPLERFGDSTGELALLSDV
jgi:hypothetical protein